MELYEQPVMLSLCSLKQNQQFRSINKMITEALKDMNELEHREESDGTDVRSQCRKGGLAVVDASACNLLSQAHFLC